jgi:hypothetical protein
MPLIELELLDEDDDKLPLLLADVGTCELCTGFTMSL